MKKLIVIIIMLIVSGNVGAMGGATMRVHPDAIGGGYVLTEDEQKQLANIMKEIKEDQAKSISSKEQEQTSVQRRECARFADQQDKK